MRKSKVLVSKDSKSNLIDLERRMKANQKKYDIDKDKQIIVNMINTAFDLEEKIHEKYLDKANNDGYNMKKNYLMRLFVYAYVYGFIDIKDLEEKLEKLDVDVFL